MTLRDVLKQHGAPEALIAQMQATEAGKLAKEFGGISYYTWKDRDGKCCIGGNYKDEKQLRELFYRAQALLEDVAMREVLARHFPD